MAKSDVRRSIIREWMSLARDKRQSGEQAVAFAKAAIERHPLKRKRQPAQVIVMRWLKPRTGRP